MPEREERLEYERRILALEVSLEAAERVIVPAQKLSAVMRRNTDNLDCALTVAQHRPGWQDQDFSVEPWMPLVEAIDAAQANLPALESDDEWRCKLEMVRHNTPDNPQPASSSAFKGRTRPMLDAPK